MQSHKIEWTKEIVKGELQFSALLRDLAAELRLKQWVKNLLLFLPLVFARELFNSQKLITVFAGFICFGLVASAVYMINDFYDMACDRLHPVKKLRPLAAGRLPSALVLAVSGTLSSGAIAISFYINDNFGILIALYFLANLLYSESLKHKIILDVLAIALMFVLRVYSGAVLAGVEASYWLLICTFTLALFLGFAKRRHELTLLHHPERLHRHVLKHYSAYFLDQMIAVATTSTLMSYILYTISDQTFRKFGTHGLVYTTPFVVYGIFRYLYLIHGMKKGGDPASVILSDSGMLANLMLWGGTVILILYLR